MTSIKREIASLGVGTLLSALGLAFGSYDPLWNQFGIDTGIRSGLTTAVSLFFLLFGFLLAIYLKFAAEQDYITKNLASLKNELKFEIPQLSAFRVLDADAALRYLESQLPVMQAMINTRIASNTNAGYRTIAGTSYSQSIEKAITETRLHLKELINKPWQESAESRKKNLSKKSLTGSYDYQLLETTLPSFLNFSVVTYADGQKEVLFGWAITKGRRFEQKCFATNEKSVVDFFDAWFNDLYLAAV